MTEEALRAFRGITLLGFDVVRSSYGFFPHFLVEVDERGRGGQDRGAGAVRDVPREVLLQQRADAIDHGATRRAGRDARSPRDSTSCGLLESSRRAVSIGQTSISRLCIWS